MYIKAKQNDLKVMYFRNKNIFKRHKYLSPKTSNKGFFTLSPACLLLNHPHTNFKKMVCPRNIQIHH